MWAEPSNKVVWILFKWNCRYSAIQENAQAPVWVMAIKEKKIISNGHPTLLIFAAISADLHCRSSSSVCLASAEFGRMLSWNDVKVWFQYHCSDWGCIVEHQTRTRFRSTYESGIKNIRFHVICAVHIVLKKSDFSKSRFWRLLLAVRMRHGFAICVCLGFVLPFCSLALDKQTNSIHLVLS